MAYWFIGNLRTTQHRVEDVKSVIPVSALHRMSSFSHHECVYTVTLVINTTTGSNNIYLVSWESVSSIELPIMQHYWLIAIHKTYWIPNHLHEMVDPEHIITNPTLLFHRSKLSLTQLISSHFHPRSVAPRTAPSSAKCNVHFRVPQNLKSFTKQWRLTSLKFDANYTTNADHCTGIFTKSLHLHCLCLM